MRHFPQGVAPEKRRASIDRCPVKYLTPDVCAVASAVTLADSRLSMSEQDDYPRPWVQAFSVMSAELKAASAARMRRK